MNKFEKAMRKAWRKEAERLANHDLELLRKQHKIMVHTIKRLKVHKIILIIALFVAVAAGVIGWLF